VTSIVGAYIGNEKSRQLTFCFIGGTSPGSTTAGVEERLTYLLRMYVSSSRARVCVLRAFFPLSSFIISVRRDVRRATDGPRSRLRSPNAHGSHRPYLDCRPCNSLLFHREIAKFLIARRREARKKLGLFRASSIVAYRRRRPSSVRRTRIDPNPPGPDESPPWRTGCGAKDNRRDVESIGTRRRLRTTRSPSRDKSRRKAYLNLSRRPAFIRNATG